MNELSNNVSAFEDVYVDYNSTEKEIDGLLKKVGFYLQTYRSLDAMPLLDEALRKSESQDVRWQLKATVYRLIGEAQSQMGNADKAISFFFQMYDIQEDDNDKAATASMIADHYYRLGNKAKALELAKKSLETAKDPVLFIHPYRIQGAIASEEGDYTGAIELMNKAAHYAEETHCVTDLAMTIMDISATFMSMDKIETALSEIYRAERYVKECRCLELYMRCAVRRAHILYRMGKDDEAKALIIALDNQKN